MGRGFGRGRELIGVRFAVGAAGEPAQNSTHAHGKHWTGTPKPSVFVIYRYPTDLGCCIDP